MATTSNMAKAKADNNNLSRTKSIGRKPKQPSSVSSEDGSDQKPEKPLPNYLKPTISSRPDPVKFLKKNDQDNQKLLRRRSFDRPPSSLPSASTPSPRVQKTLNASPSLPRDKPAVPKEKPATALRSSSFHGSRGVPRGSSSVKSPHVAPKKSGLGSSSTSLKSKKEGPEHVAEKKAPEKEIALDTASLSSAQEDEEEILKVESDAQVAEDVEEPKEEKENKEVHVEVVHVDTSGEENESSGSTLVVPVVEDIVVVVAKENEREEEEKEERVINEHISEEKIEEQKEQEDKGELTGEVTSKIDEDETSEKVDADTDTKEVENAEEVESVEETREEKEEVKEEKEVKREEKEKEKVKEQESGEAKKKEVVKGKKESPSAYNDVIASKMQENPRKNKVLALAGAFQTVIDYETAASK
ncbi:glutamic acid-rich protein [Brassica rapa]|uniref:Calmodulin-binding domain-containing protein n=2 Tax=Brassica TaxID=3705 RepID=M4D004_BRACM|nr:glutamic acid-rich protein [Brassica rapa]CAF2088956.1 unnamed protein product [Brassica napus]